MKQFRKILIHWPTLFSLSALVAVSLASCTPEQSTMGNTASNSVTEATASAEASETGTLEIYANAEERMQTGFVSKDGWDLRFEHLYLTLAEVTAYQTNPPYDPQQKSDISATHQVSLPEVQTVDLITGNAENPLVLVGQIQNAPVGHYNAIAWRMVPAARGDAQGYPLVLVGTAERDGQTVQFVWNLEQEFAYRCGEFVGEERKGIVQANGTANLEVTFHFDHLFGEAAKPASDPLNQQAFGFEPIAALAREGRATVTMADLKAAVPAVDYQRLVAVLTELGHAGEGHCYEVNAAQVAN